MQTVGKPLVFEVMMAVPAWQQRSCDSWFGSREVSEHVRMFSFLYVVFHKIK
jgi:hypothetical protein